MGEDIEKNLLDKNYLYCPPGRIAELSRSSARKVKDSGYKPDALVGIKRGAYMLMRYFLDEIDFKLKTMMGAIHYDDTAVTLETPEITEPLQEDLSGLKVLIVDDVADTGESLKLAVKHIEEKGAIEVRTASLHLKPESNFVPDYYAEVTKEKTWIIYDWELKEFVKDVIKNDKYTDEDKRIILYEKSGIPKDKLEQTLDDLRRYDNIKL